MTREIKFRAWHLSKKIMAEVGDFNWTGKVHISYKQGPEKSGYFFGGNNVGDDWLKDEHILMQFTGLKDKNGKEIYEGDIITFIYKTSVRDDGTTAIWEIYWHDGGFSYGKKSEKYAMSVYHEWASRVEVIGNIYETPHLLSTTDNGQ